MRSDRSRGVADDDVEAARAQGMRFLEHLVGLSDAGRRSDVDPQARPLLFLRWP
jgi:hypothetical protein